MPGVRVLPLVHDRLDFAVVVRAALDALDPAAVAVELPTPLAAAAERAVARLPKVSLLVSEEPGEDALVWAVAPGDPLAEALRWAVERGRRCFFVDPDVRYVERHPDPVPDPYALWDVGIERFLSLLEDHAGRRPAGDADRIREAGMAYHAGRARAELDRAGEPSRPLLLLVGAAHAGRLRHLLPRPAATPLARTHRSSLDLRHLHPESLTALLPDPPLAHALWELLRSAAPWVPEGPELPSSPPLGATLARRLSLVRHGLRLLTREEDRDGDRRHRVLEYAAHHGVRRGPGGRPVPDRRALAAVAWAVGSRSYSDQTQEEIRPWQRRLFFDFTRRHSRCQGLLVPGLYEWVVAARGAADDNLAWEVFEVARTYPWQQDQAELPVARVDGSELDLGTRRVTFRRRFFRVKQRPVAVPVRTRPTPDDPEEWLEGFQRGGLCSYPPEDLVVEDYGRFLRHKATSLLAAEKERSEPFSASLLDGIDLRETLRHVEEDRIWVRELGRAPGEAGAVVVIFDRDLTRERYPYLMTWLGEHPGESDMAFYATHPAEQVVGPGIMRATYGGFLMTLPPGRLFDVWRDPDYRGAREKAEVLLLAAVDYSREKLIVHAGKAPPPEPIRRHASLQGKRIVHIPLGSLSPTALKNLRVLHILVGHDKRTIAKDYIW